ncbi:MAG: iron ABC transporter permease [Candidatus Methanomethylophilaceae archaeon]|nr:iron ABC transporter permease [Candidatus Methanomethylophilaceae archaeon]
MTAAEDIEKISDTDQTDLKDRRSYIKIIYNASTQKKKTFIIIMTALLLAVVVVSLSLGSVLIPAFDVLACLFNQIIPNSFTLSESYFSNIIINGREPRILLCILTGIALGASGTVMQSLLRNPLVSPFTLGVSSAAAFGAAMAIAFGAAIFGSAYYGIVEIIGISFSAKTLITILFAFLFGTLSMVLVLIISKNNIASQSVLVLSGVVVGYLFQAGVSFAKYVSDDAALREIVNWLMGGMWGATWSSIVFIVPIVLVGFILLERRAVDMNTMSGGDDVAKSLGIDVRKIRRNLLIVCTLITSACLAFTGVIGFIGLMAPHICRILIGNDNRYLIPASALMGAVILLISDTVARIIMSPQELPVGILLYLIGGVFFIWLVSRKNGRYLA